MARPVPLSEGENVAPAKGKRKKQYPPLISGHPVRFRRSQKLLWVGIAAALGVGFIAGLYWFGFQQDYHNIFPFLPKGTSLKAWWDNGMGFIHSENWKNGIWRHGVRDKAQPETWAIFGGVLLGAALPRRPVGMVWLILGALVMFALVIAGALAITWFTVFGPGKHLPDPFNAQDFILGLLVGRILHYLWRPLASSVRYHLTRNAGKGGGVPLWVTLPLAPPAWRESWSVLKRDGKIKLRSSEKTDKFKQSRIFVPLGVLVFLVIASTGLLAKYGFAHGLHVALLNP